MRRRNFVKQGVVASFASFLPARLFTDDTNKKGETDRPFHLNYAFHHGMFKAHAGNDFIDQIRKIKKMGNVKDLMSMIPGMGKAIKDIDIDENAFKGIEAIIQSMTPLERENPSVLNGSRRKRIAQGSGNDIQEVNRLIKQFDDTRKMMKMLTTGGAQKMAQQMKNAKRR